MEENAWENNNTVKVRRDDVILFIDRNNHFKYTENK